MNNAFGLQNSKYIFDQKMHSEMYNSKCIL